jgi:hypothetical protein
MATQFTTDGKSEVQQQMDAAAAKAAAEFQASWNATQVAQWWKKWFITAGHKRLGRILVKAAGG